MEEVAVVGRVGSIRMLEKQEENLRVQEANILNWLEKLNRPQARFYFSQTKGLKEETERQNRKKGFEDQLAYIRLEQRDVRMKLIRARKTKEREAGTSDIQPVSYGLETRKEDDVDKSKTLPWDRRWDINSTERLKILGSKDLGRRPLDQSVNPNRDKKATVEDASSDLEDSIPPQTSKNPEGTNLSSDIEKLWVSEWVQNQRQPVDMLSTKPDGRLVPSVARRRPRDAHSNSSAQLSTPSDSAPRPVFGFEARQKKESSREYRSDFERVPKESAALNPTRPMPTQLSKSSSGIYKAPDSESQIKRAGMPIKKKQPMFTLGGSSDDSELETFFLTERSSLTDHLKRPSSITRKLPTFKDAVNTFQESNSGLGGVASDVIDSNDEIDESAIDDSDSEEWEDSVDEDDGSPAGNEEILFKRVDSRSSMVSRRSLLTEMINGGTRALPQETLSPPGSARKENLLGKAAEDVSDEMRSHTLSIRDPPHLRRGECCFILPESDAPNGSHQRCSCRSFYPDSLVRSRCGCGHHAWHHAWHHESDRSDDRLQSSLVVRGREEAGLSSAPPRQSQDVEARRERLEQALEYNMALMKEIYGKDTSERAKSGFSAIEKMADSMSALAEAQSKVIEANSGRTPGVEVSHHFAPSSGASNQNFAGGAKERDFPHFSATLFPFSFESSPSLERPKLSASSPTPPAAAAQIRETSSEITLKINIGDDLELESTDALPYQLLRNLGVGGNASVEMVRDRNTGSIYARKILRNIYARNVKEAKRAFHNEIQVVRRLAAHHHIIQVHATYIVKRELGLILSPVADGGDLALFLQEFKDSEIQDPLHPSRVILNKAFGCLASALDFIHRRKIRHKDIKPQNILIHQGSIIYTDFGLSLDFLETNSTTTGALQGLTKRYCAPEVENQGRRNSKSDIFSLGCVYIEILAALHHHESLDDLLEANFYLTAIDPVFLASNYFPEESKYLFFKSMLAVDPGQRPTAADLVRELRENSKYRSCQRCIAFEVA